MKPMPHKTLNRWIAGFVFVASLAVYWKTLAPTIVFWDVGEFCAAAYSLQIPHPPGAPLFLLLARISSMIPLFSDIAVRMHFLSALGSAVTCSLLYFIIVDLVLLQRNIPETIFERMSLYGSAVIGALSLAFARTFWFNAVEAEVYGLSMTCVGLIILLGLRWYACTDTKNGDRFILLIAYIIGLSIGVHLLAVLALFPVMLFWYFRQKKFSWSSFFIFGVCASAIFLVIYPGIVSILPSLLDGYVKAGSLEIRHPVVRSLPAVLLAAVFAGIYFSVKKRNRILHLALVSFLLIILGYSTYLVVFIRAHAQPPMNENDPSTIGRLVSYLNREQYGNAPIFNRRWDSDPEKRKFHAAYSSDLEYMLSYQINHMYLRYLAWNYIGADGDSKDAGIDWKQYICIPFLIGLLGVWYQWRKQPPMALAMTAAFIIMGIVLALYQNQQEPQPRERDYFYVGSFFVFSLWIAYGVLALIDFIGSLPASKKTLHILGYSTLALAFILIPVHMLFANYHQADRSGNYVAWDYSYNMLQSCEKDAILVTNGDNDTFPLWYLQDVEGIRRDIRIVNLSLLNIPWYILQLKHGTPYGSKKVPMNTSDAEIEHIGPVRYDPRWMELPVDPDLLRRLESEGTFNSILTDSTVIAAGAIRFYMPHTIEGGSIKGLRIQDIILYDIIMSNNWQRPLCFGTTVSDDNKLGLQDYLQTSGLTMKLFPGKSEYRWAHVYEPAVQQNLFTDVSAPSKEPARGFLWRGFQDSTTYYDEDTRRLITTNYRNLFISYALYCLNKKNTPQQISIILDRMEHVIPQRSLPMDYRVKYDLAAMYALGKNNERYASLLQEVIEEAKQEIQNPVKEPLSQYNPYILLYYSYNGLHRFADAENIVVQIQSVYRNETGIDRLAEQLRTQIRLQQSAVEKMQQHKK